MSTVRIPVAPEVLDWAVSRVGLHGAKLYKRFPKWDDWKTGRIPPTNKQLEKIARATHTPVGFLYLPEPFQFELPISDFRKIAGANTSMPSPDLLDTIHISQLRQHWYKEYVQNEGFEPLPFVGSVSISENPYTIAKKIKNTLTITEEDRKKTPDHLGMLQLLRTKAEELGILVFTNGIVGSNTQRTLDPTEFRGFALADERAPVVFINAADSKPAQIFTLMHEIAHVWLGASGLSDLPVQANEQETEVWCNKVAAEFLVPIAELNHHYDPNQELKIQIENIAQTFKVSTLVILRRLYDAEKIDFTDFKHAYSEELKNFEEKKASRKSKGGDYYKTTLQRTGNRFAQAIVTSTWEGETSFTEAMRLLGITNMRTFKKFSNQVSEKLGWQV